MIPEGAFDLIDEGVWVGGVLLEGVGVVHRYRVVRDRTAIFSTLTFTFIYSYYEIHQLRLRKGV